MTNWIEFFKLCLDLWGLHLCFGIVAICVNLVHWFSRGKWMCYVIWSMQHDC